MLEIIRLLTTLLLRVFAVSAGVTCKRDSTALLMLTEASLSVSSVHNSLSTMPFSKPKDTGWASRSLRWLYF